MTNSLEKLQETNWSQTNKQCLTNAVANLDAARLVALDIAKLSNDTRRISTDEADLLRQIEARLGAVQSDLSPFKHSYLKEFRSELSPILNDVTDHITLYTPYRHLDDVMDLECLKLQDIIAQLIEERAVL